MNATLDDATLKSGQAPDPFAVFSAWLEEAAASEPNDANAMALATADASGLPNVRMVLLKGHDATGFVFYTNLESVKGAELSVNPQAALLFHWKSLRRQVRVRGKVAPVTAAEADTYFASRARGSRIGAWASDQSRPVPDRAEIERRVAEREAAYGEDVPRPPHWSGFRLTPVTMEFWKDGQYRLHDRFAYTREADDGEWSVRRLFP